MNTKTKEVINREAWLTHAVDALTPIFTEQGHVIPRVRVSCAFPSSSHKGSAVGQCWGTSFSSDGVNEIFITPVFSKAFDVLDTLTHELVHAVDNCEHKHGRVFKEIATSIGLEGKMIYASAGAKLKERLLSISDVLINEFGNYPHGAMFFPESKQASTRLSPRAVCPICNFQVTVSRKSLDFGPPICPKHKILMERKGKWK